jgi:hypothetical protein
MDDESFNALLLSALRKNPAYNDETQWKHKLQPSRDPNDQPFHELKLKHAYSRTSECSKTKDCFCCRAIFLDVPVREIFEVLGLIKAAAKREEILERWEKGLDYKGNFNSDTQTNLKPAQFD